jgi:glycosyltransferase involved in cell wall biosynthesis
MNPAQRPIVLVSHGFQAHYELGFANGLAENGRDVVLFGSDTTLSAGLHPRVRFLNLRGSHDPRRPRWRKAADMLRYHLRLLWQVVRLRGSPIVCIGTPNPEWTVGVGEGLWFSLWGSSYAIVVHNVLPHEQHTDAMRRVHRLIWRIPRWLLVHTEATRQALVREFALAPERILSVPHGLNDAVPRSPLSREAAKVALGVGAHERTVLLFGRTGPYKGGDLVLDSLPHLPPLRLLVAGKSGPDRHGIEFTRRVAALVAQGRAWQRDAYLGEAEISAAFAAADVAVLPYRHIDQSGVLLLALSLGVPVLTTRVGGLAELVDGRNGAFIASPSVDDVAIAIETFFKAQAPTAEAVRGSVAHLAWRHTLREYLARLEATEAAGVPHARPRNEAAPPGERSS